jgi:hypothetical protein
MEKREDSLLENAPRLQFSQFSQPSPEVGSLTLHLNKAIPQPNRGESAKHEFRALESYFVLAGVHGRLQVVFRSAIAYTPPGSTAPGKACNPTYAFSLSSFLPGSETSIQTLPRPHCLMFASTSAMFSSVAPEVRSSRSKVL